MYFWFFSVSSVGYFSSNGMLLHSLFWNRNDVIFFHECHLFLVPASVSIWMRLCMEICLCKWRGGFTTSPTVTDSISVILFFRRFLKSNFLEDKYCSFLFLSLAISTQPRQHCKRCFIWRALSSTQGSGQQPFTDDDFPLTIYVPNLLTLFFLLFCEHMPFSQKHCFLASVSYLCSFIYGPSPLLLRGLVCTFLRLERYFLFPFFWCV